MSNAVHRAVTRRGIGRVALALALAGTVAACSSSRFASNQQVAEPEQLQPVQSSTVQSSNLPPVDGQQQQTLQAGTQQQLPGDGVLRTPEGQPINVADGTGAQSQTMVNSRIGPDGQTVGTTQTFSDNMVSQDPMVAQSANPELSGGQPIGADPALVAANPPAGSGTRDLSGGLTTDKLLGSWTVIAGGQQCQVNLTQTSAPASDRFRASAPDCPIDVLNGLASWRLAGSQVQFYSQGGELIGALLQSGNRFIGTLSGGRGISMAG